LDQRSESIIQQVRNELRAAVKKYGPFNNVHEAYAVLLEEFDELWEAVKIKQGTPCRREEVRREAIQVAAMAIRLIYDCLRENVSCSIEYFQNPKRQEWLRKNLPYIMGRSFEYQVMNYLRKRGWSVVRKFGSWGEEDLIATFPRGEQNGVRVVQVWYIQCKYSKQGETKPEDMPLEERRKFVEKARKHGGYAMFAGVGKPDTRPRLYFRFLEDFLN